jgi:hypothetical protein
VNTKRWCIKDQGNATGEKLITTSILKIDPSNIDAVNLIPIRPPKERKADVVSDLILPLSLHRVFSVVRTTLPSKPPIIRRSRMALSQPNVFERYGFSCVVFQLECQSAYKREVELAGLMIECVLVARDSGVPPVGDSAGSVTTDLEGEVLVVLHSSRIEAMDIANTVLVFGILAGTDAKVGDGESAIFDRGSCSERVCEVHRIIVIGE